MKKSERLVPIRQIAADHEQAAVKELGQTRKALTEHEIKLEQLKNYRAEYARLFQQHGEQGMDGAKLHAYQSFLAQLDAAIRAQFDMIQRVNIECEQKRQAWQQRHTRTEALGKTVERFQQHERMDEERKEQREADDRTNNLFWKNNQ